MALSRRCNSKLERWLCRALCAASYIGPIGLVDAGRFGARRRLAAARPPRRLYANADAQPLSRARPSRALPSRPSHLFLLFPTPF